MPGKLIIPNCGKRGIPPEIRIPAAAAEYFADNQINDKVKENQTLFCGKRGNAQEIRVSAGGGGFSC